MSLSSTAPAVIIDRTYILAINTTVGATDNDTSQYTITIGREQTIESGGSRVTGNNRRPAVSDTVASMFASTSFASLLATLNAGGITGPSLLAALAAYCDARVVETSAQETA